MCFFQAHMHAQALIHGQLFETPWTVLCQAPLSMGFFQASILEWFAISFSRGSSQPGIKPQSPAGSIPTELPGKPFYRVYLLFYLIYHSLASTGGTTGKELPCHHRRHKRCRFDPWVGKILWRRAQLPTPVGVSGESHGQRSLVGSGP